MVVIVNSVTIDTDAVDTVVVFNAAEKSKGGSMPISSCTWFVLLTFFNDDVVVVSSSNAVVFPGSSSTFVAGKLTIVMGLHIITADSITAAAFVGESCFVHVLASTTVVHLPMLESRSGCTGVGLAVETCSFN